MRLTTRTNLAARVLMYCAINDEGVVKTTDIAKSCNCSTNHLAHVTQRLHREGFLDTQRGRSGGLKLSRSPENISIGEVFRLFEDDIPFAECFSQEGNSCPLHESCRLKRYIERALEAFYHELDLVTLDDLVRGNCGLRELLEIMPDTHFNCTQSKSPQPRVSLSIQ